MMQAPILRTYILLFLLLGGGDWASAQPDFRLPLAKPEAYRDKELGSEKTEEKKFTLPRRLFQGMITHYNYYYNAQTKLEAIVQKARLAHKDDYTELLPFYNYSTERTAGDSLELDSILYKATAGIVLHDLRNSYIDNLYLLIGKSYFYWQKFDSAYRIFQFINYNFFPKGKDEYFIVVGANNRSDGGELNIATQEKKGLIRKAFSQPPSRNEALLWLVKTYAEDSLFAEANSLVQLLRKDRLFPRRLHPQLDEVLAYTFYRQEQWDSAAFYLERALVNAPNKTELARWEYLLAQLHALRNRPETASAWFNKAKTHTTDPVLYIHARIYEAQLVKRTDRDPLQDALADLLKLTRKERFDGYEDVLYYAAAGIALKKQDTMQARRLLLQSTRYNTENPPLRNKAYLQMATLAYRQRDYAFAAGCYDSLDLQDPWVMQAGEELERRKEVLRELVQQIRVVQREDSLQRIAQLPEKELETYLRNLVKQLRKQRGLKEEESSYFNPAVVTGGQATDQPLFQTAGSGGAWYFNITAQRSKGFSEFKGRWGNRPNIDNWRRQSAIDVFAGAPGAMPGNPGGDVDRPGGAAAGADDDEEGDLTVESLREKLPFSDEQVRESNLKIVEALFRQGQIYKNQLEDYAEAARTFEEIWKRFQGFEQEEATLFELYYCYQKAGEPEKSARFRKLLQQKFPEGNYEQKITQATSPASPEADAKTRTYQTIYNLFIEGRFTEALQQKARADSIYGTSYWTPQLLYIESLYHIRQRNDSTALETLTRIEANFPGTPMAGKAAIVKDVLNRRAEIEDYLTRTPIVRQQEDAIIIPFDAGPQVQKTGGQQVKKDTTAATVVTGPLPAQQTQLEKPKAPVQKVSQEKEQKQAAGQIGMGKLPVKDSLQLKPSKDVKVEMAYVYNATDPHLVLMYFDKVDPVYISESRIAFQRYNRSSHSSEEIPINVYIQETDDLYWMELGNYPGVASVLGYFDELKQNARQIVPWLPAEKYEFIIISDRNLELLKTRKNIQEYKLFIGQYIKDKF